jgi:hypothetical protein
MQWPTGGPIAEQVWQLDQRRAGLSALVEVPTPAASNQAQDNFPDYVRSNRTSGDAGTLTFHWLCLPLSACGNGGAKKD